MKQLVIPPLAALVLTACASAPKQPEQPLVPFTCTGEPASLTADYYSGSRTPYVILKTGDTDLKLTQTATTQPGSLKFANARHTPAESGSYSWYTKGTEGILYIVTDRTNGSRYERQLAYCTSAPKPLREHPTTLPVPGTVLPGTIPGTAPGIQTAPQPTSQAPQPATANPTAIL